MNVSEYIPLLASVLTFLGVLYQGRKVYKSAQSQLAADNARRAEERVDNNEVKRIDNLQEDVKREQERNEALLERFNKLVKQVDEAREQTETVKETLSKVVEDNRNLRYNLKMSIAFIKQQQEHARNHNIPALEIPELLRSI